MHFKDMPYERVTYEKVEQRYQQLMDDFQNAGDVSSCLKVLDDRYRLLADMTPIELCYVRHDLDVNDAFYAAEQDYYDEIGPRLSDLSSRLDRLILDSPFRPELEKILGTQVFTIMEAGQSGFDSRLIGLMQEENTLLGQYNRLVSNATAQWDGDLVKRSLLTPLTQSPDRETRKKASLAISDSWDEQQADLEKLYGQLVENRNRQALTLGFPHYTELSYYRMNRIGYGPEEVTAFREQVKRHLVPFFLQLEERRRVRLGLNHLYQYDNGIYFPNGNPKPAGDTAASLEATREMYTRLSPETAEFIAFLLDNGLYDVEIRKGKRDGGYMTSFEKYRSPFILANFDGTSENAYIMCHEGGHAFQNYLKRGTAIREHCWLTSEAAETHAMAMEFFTAPYMELFFGDRADDYRTMHLEDAVRLIISECQQDEFQQRIYEQPDLSPAERNALWARLDKEYFPGRDYGDNTSLVEGRGWQRIPHMFLWPFYAIDYALAEICALEYYRFSTEDFPAAWQSYLKFCRETGTMSFPELVKSAGLDHPFQEGTLQKLIDWLQTQF